MCQAYTRRGLKVPTKFRSGQLGEMELQFTEKKKTEGGTGSGRETDKFSSPRVPLRPAAFPGCCAQ